MHTDAIDAHKAIEDEELAGLDALEQEVGTEGSRGRALWGATWPKLAAALLAVLAWQVVVWSHWKPDYVLPGPGTVFPKLIDTLEDSLFWQAMGNTLQRAIIGYAISVVLGTVLGAAVARVPVLRKAVGSVITGLQTMPSIAWFPLAILLFQLSEGAIMFVVVMGAAPSIANGLLTGIDQIPPLTLRVGHVLGARGWSMFRSVVLPAALPGYCAGLKQGWAFAWRGLMAGELLVIIGNKPSIGARMDFARQFN
ncbi:MAG: ABC transporter permease, partial [Acidimicrobiia bacterium]